MSLFTDKDLAELEKYLSKLDQAFMSSNNGGTVDVKALVARVKAAEYVAQKAIAMAKAYQYGRELSTLPADEFDAAVRAWRKTRGQPFTAKTGEA